MKSTLINYRNDSIKFLYHYMLKPVFFLMDPEVVHDHMTHVGNILGNFAFTRALTKACFSYQHPMLRQTIAGITFENPIGLAAGFDKNAELVNILPSIGFGFVEVGSITVKPCTGNPKPRLWRLLQSQGLVVYYGLKNLGADVLAKRLAGNTYKIPIGTSIAMTNCKENLDTARAIEDYAYSFATFASIGEYTTVNISCPNAEGCQTFMSPEKLDALLTRLDTIATHKPVFIKISPDLSFTEVDALLDVAKQHNVQGIICSNLTKPRTNDKIKDIEVPKVGGISGKPVQDLSDALLAHMYRREKDRFIFIGCGGVFRAEDAYKKIRLGASLVQLVTGMIFQGPQIISQINKDLVAILTRDGFTSLVQARGVDNQ